ncbi:hypothetical protein OG730_41625 (plasmid) [Streptomyces sp. NBC_01298]|uniref:hypothetical protein n=1 Tax=Streptomyces sp. NBC_01298 TaxID=2903817 RepID=UPI002E114231|nr:hypothetical protein OG730_41625 [Streptomyces sp. NBC_01298]
MKATPSGYVLEFPHILEGLRDAAAQCRNPAHRTFVNTAIAAFEQEGPDAEPLLNGCPLRIAQLIFDEVSEAYITTQTADRVREQNSILARDFQRPYTAHRRAQSIQARRARRIRKATGMDRLRAHLTIG